MIKHIMLLKIVDFLNRMKSHLALTSLILGVVSSSFGQVETMYSLYRFNPQVISPAYAGSTENSEVTVMNRQQWIGLEGAPKTIGMSMMEAGRFFHVRKICEAIPAGALSAWDEGVGLNRFAQSAASQKTIGNFLLAAAISGQQEGLVINLLEFTQPDPERCFKAEAELAVQPYLSGIIGDYLKGERAFLIAAISSVLAQEDPSDLSRIMSGQAPAKGWARVEQVVRRYGPAGWLKQNLANTVRGTGELIGAFDPAMKPEDQRQREAQVIAVSKSKGALFHWMERDTIGIYGGLYEPVIQTDTRRNLLRAALLIAAHRSGTGVAPMSLDELPAELRSRIPVSPWNGDMPRIKRDEHGVWTLAYGGTEERKTGEPEFSVRIRSW